MLAFGCYALSGTLGQNVALRGSFGELPFLGISLTGAFLIAFLAFVLGSFFWVRWLGQPKIADHLIEVEGELNKVVWPSFSEATNSSIVVVVTILILMGFLSVADW
ncbi:MAG: preprotein translocase subunit SecE, partial [Planctomycetes bacterium]|nr:preprotein translocase subunit SecE [Planctomycetota bacterium]